MTAIGAQRLPARIEYHIVVAMRGPIISRAYSVGNSSVKVVYPGSVVIPSFGTLAFPEGLSTMFQVAWEDVDGATVNKMESKGAERFEPLYDALDQINEVLLAYKLVRIGHLHGREIRTVGEADVLFWVAYINGLQTRDLTISLRTHRGPNPWGFANAKHPEDPLGTTDLALPHIGQPTFSVGRKFARCFDLIEHGYYTEALVVSFSILDDQVQLALLSLMAAKGLNEVQRDQLVRGVKEERLKIYLGPVLKLVCMKSVMEMWPGSEAALKWVNRARNDAMHGGYRADRSSAGLALFASMKILLVLARNGVISMELPSGMYRQARVFGASARRGQKWAPCIDEIENIDD